MLTCTTKVTTTAALYEWSKSGARLSHSVKRTDHIPKTDNVLTVILHLQDEIIIYLFKLNLDLIKNKNLYQLKIIMHLYILFFDDIDNEIDLNW